MKKRNAASGFSHKELKLILTVWGIGTTKQKRTEMVDWLCKLVCLVLLVGDRDHKRVLRDSAGEPRRPEIQCVVKYVKAEYSAAMSAGPENEGRRELIFDLRTAVSEMPRCKKGPGQRASLFGEGDSFQPDEVVVDPAVKVAREAQRAYTVGAYLTRCEDIRRAAENELIDKGQAGMSGAERSSARKVALLINEEACHHAGTY